MIQLELFSSEPSTDERPSRLTKPLPGQLLKWIGNKQRFAHQIVGYFPEQFGSYFEPFVGSGAVLATLGPARATASDTLKPLIEIWQSLKSNPEVLKTWYTQRWQRYFSGDHVSVYEEIKAAYNTQPNAADLLFLSRSCYGGVVRFRQSDGYMSTPCGVHRPVAPESFAKRVDLWHTRIRGTTFLHSDFEPVMNTAQPGDLVYCDPPYTFTQRILYRAQSFNLERLFEAIQRCKSRGVYVALSIDGTKRSGNLHYYLPIPQGLFKREVRVDCGRSMLRRFQMEGQTLEGEVVTDRLLLTY